MEENAKKSCKIVLLGNSGVGKTSLVTRWTTGNYKEGIRPTVGANHQRKCVVLQNEEVELFLWDTAGQEQFQALTPLYARSAASAIIVASITDRESVAALDSWIGLLSSSCGNPPPIVLAVNKIDSDEMAMTVEEIEQRCQGKFSAIFFVSALTGEGVDEAFLHAAQLGYEFNHNATTTNGRKLDDNSERKRCC